MDHETSIPQEFSRVLADLVPYYITAAGENEAGVRQRTGRTWQYCADNELLALVETFSRLAKRTPPDRNRIMRMARIRCLAGSDAANYRDNLFALTDERLKSIENGLLLNTPKAYSAPQSAS